MAARFAWVLNLDADLELGAIASGSAGARTAYTPKRSTREAMRAFAPRIAASLLDPKDDVVVDDDTPPNAARGLIGRAFCPTPRALRLLRRAGAEPEPHPTCDALVRANSRAFASSLGATLPEAAFVSREDDARALLALPPPRALAQAWRVKRNFGMTGRGQRVVASTPTEQDIAFVRAGLAEGGVQIEPNVTILSEYTIHGLLDPSGVLTLGRVLKQRCDARGAWIASDELATDEAPGGLEEEARRVAAALHQAGYFGPFGVDAYTYRRHETGDGATALQVRSEINARYTMGFGLPVPKQT